jgi:hypothetical protein
MERSLARILHWPTLFPFVLLGSVPPSAILHPSLNLSEFYSLCVTCTAYLCKLMGEKWVEPKSWGFIRIPFMYIELLYVRIF